ncbi:MAG TPA: ABC transporter ATP-binding protein [Lachnospiraceae bacterium]|nr:ABC transporter ATP-binding protein [Lachnospiraceae bacterium]
MADLVETRGLVKIYDQQTIAVNNLTITIPQGRIVGLLGPNGSGKTTLIKMLTGLLTPTQGSILIDGNPVGPMTKSMISYLPERNYLGNNTTIAYAIDFYADFYEDFSKEKAYDMLTSLGLNPNSRIKTLSKGTKEKVQLILVMSRNAKLYILDEPIAGVDPAARDYIIKTIINSCNPEATVLLSTHLITDVENILDDVIFMRYGQIMLQTSVDEIRQNNRKSVDAFFREVFAC